MPALLVPGSPVAGEAVGNDIVHANLHLGQLQAINHSAALVDNVQEHADNERNLEHGSFRLS